MSDREGSPQQEGIVVPSSQQTSPVTVGESLPRTIRTRLGRMKAGERKTTKNEADTLAAAEAAGPGVSNALAEVLARRPAESARAAKLRSKGADKEAYTSRLWNAQRGSEKLRKNHVINQPCPRSLEKNNRQTVELPPGAVLPKHPGRVE